MTREYWNFVCKNMHSFGNLGDDDYCLKILSLSYKSLPIYMKPCFLYLQIFPEDDEIETSFLIHLWIAEGFIKQVGDKSLEDLAWEYVNDLIDRNLLFARQRYNGGKVWSCGIHDLFRELCIQEFEKEHFLCPKVQCVKGCDAWKCHLCGEFETNAKSMNLSEIAFNPSSSASDVIVCICDMCRTKLLHISRAQILIEKKRRHQLEKAMDCFFVKKLFNEKLVQHVGLRYLHIEDVDSLKVVYGSMLSVLWNLHTIILTGFFKDLVVLPPEIWDMPQLRQLVVDKGVLPHPPEGCGKGNDIMIMKNLQSLCVKVTSISVEVVSRIQNLERVELSCEVYDRWVGECPDCSLVNNDCSLTNLGRLHKLKYLTLRLCKVENISFPNSLVELHLSGLENPSKALSIIGLLPKLESLKLEFVNNWLEWRPSEGQFLQLKRFVIYSCGLKCWEADHTHFPNLEWLNLTECEYLQEIPLAIGDIATLCLIEVYYCNENVVDLVKQLWEEQQSYGNESLRIQFVDDDDIKHVFGDLQFIDTWTDFDRYRCHATQY